MRTNKDVLREWVKASTYDSIWLRGGRWVRYSKRNIRGQENRTHSNPGTQLLFSANWGAKEFSFSAVGVLLWLQSPQKCLRRQTETEEDSKNSSWKASSIEAASCSPFPHLFLLPCTVHISFHLQQMPSWGSRSSVLLQTQQGGKWVFLWAQLHWHNPNLLPSAAQAPMNSEKICNFGFKRKKQTLQTVHH